MWGTGNSYGLSEVDGGRTLGDYTAQQRKLALAYRLAMQLASDGPLPEVFANIDLSSGDIELGQGDAVAALAYGLKPYIVAPQYSPQPLVAQDTEQRMAPLLGSHIQPNMLRSILRQIVEDA